MKREFIDSPIFVDGNQCTWVLTIGRDSTEDRVHTHLTVSTADSREWRTISDFVAAAIWWFGNALSAEYQDYISDQVNSWNIPNAKDIAWAMWAAIGSVFHQIVRRLASNMESLNIVNNDNGVVFRKRDIDVMLSRALSRIVDHSKEYKDILKEEIDNLPV